MAPYENSIAVNLQDLDEQIKSMMEVSPNHVGVGKEGIVGDIKRDIETKHITGVSHICNVCAMISRSRNS